MTTYQFNEQFTAAARQFADTAAQINKLALESLHKAFGVQLATLEENADATFAFLGEAAEVRDLDGLKALLPKGIQIARENAERAFNASQEVFGTAVKANEGILGIAKAQVEAVASQARAEADKVVKAAARNGKRA